MIGASQQFNIKRAKGVQRCILEQNIRHNEYLNVYKNCKVTTHAVSRFKSHNHAVSTVTSNKRSLSVFEDKRYWISQNESFAYGHHAIKRLKYDIDIQSI